MTRLLPLLVIVALLAFAAGRVTSGAYADQPYAWIPLRASVFTSVATPRAESDSSISLEVRSVQGPTQLGVPHECRSTGRAATPLVGAPWLSPRKSLACAGMQPAAAVSVLRPEGLGGTPHVLRGIASWGPFSGHVVTRLPRGTPIIVTGPLGTWRGLSWGYGPAKYTGRIADLDESVFAAICGAPSRGICTVTLRWSQ